VNIASDIVPRDIVESYCNKKSWTSTGYHMIWLYCVIIYYINKAQVHHENCKQPNRWSLVCQLSRRNKNALLF